MATCKNGIARARVRANNGNDSKLYANILEIYQGNRDSAIDFYTYLHSEEFKSIFGDFESSTFKGKLDENGEPYINDIVEVLQDSINTTEFNSPRRIDENTGKKL